MAFKQITAANLGAVTTLAAIGAAPNANAATISGTTLNLQPASNSFGGVVTTGAQSFAGAKTFEGNTLLGVASTTTGQETYYNSTNANTTVVKSGVPASNITFTLPATTGTSGQFLTTDGTGVLSFTTASSTALTVTSQTSNYTITTVDTVLADTSGGAFTITLPAAATTTRIIHIKKTDTSANNLTISRAGSDTIDGATTYILANPTLKPAIDLVSDQSGAWYVI